jgi:hypothetical protein
VPAPLVCPFVLKKSSPLAVLSSPPYALPSSAVNQCCHATVLSLRLIAVIVAVRPV